MDYTHLYRTVKRIIPILFIFAGLILMLVALRWGCSYDAGRKTSIKEDGSGITTPVETVGRTLDLNLSGGSGVIGSALLTDVPYGVEVALKVQSRPAQLDVEHLDTGHPASTEYPAYIHEGGTCAEDRAGNGALVKYTLYPVAVDEQGAALSMTMFSLTSSRLLSGPPKYVDVHTAAFDDGSSPAGACADLPQADGTTGAGPGGGLE